MSIPDEMNATSEPVILINNKTEALARIIQDHVRNPVQRLLVVGCGSGREAAILSRVLGVEAIGVDINTAFDPIAARMVDLRFGDATSLEFEDGAFDLVFSYHALEHIPDYRKALDEMKRVLAVDGTWCIGTPNRTRLIGYLGSKDTSIARKLAWNMADWSAKLRGKFRNEYGAHAGYSSSELRGELQRVFSQVDEISLLYYRRVYHRREGLVNILDRSGFGRFLFPSVYFMGGR